MFSQRGCQGIFCPFTVMDCISAEATALINYTWWAASCPLPLMVLLQYDRCSLIPISVPQAGLVLPYFIQHSIQHFCRRSSSKMGALQSPPRPWLRLPLFHSRHFTSLPFGDAQHGWATLLDRCSLALICAPKFHSTLLHHHHHSPCPPCTPHQILLPSWWHTSFPHKFILLPFKFHFNSPWVNLAVLTL